MRLTFACGPVRWDGFENTDVDQGDRMVDLRERPYPYEDGAADLILMSHALVASKTNILFDEPGVFEEFHRILEPGGWLRVDDNPVRVFEPGEHIPDDEAQKEKARKCSPALHRPRRQLVDRLEKIGFDVHPVAPNETLVDADAATRAAIVGNRNNHFSFSLEARKR